MEQPPEEGFVIDGAAVKQAAIDLLDKTVLMAGDGLVTETAAGKEDLFLERSTLQIYPGGDSLTVCCQIQEGRTVTDYTVVFPDKSPAGTSVHMTISLDGELHDEGHFLAGQDAQDALAAVLERIEQADEH